MIRFLEHFMSLHTEEEKQAYLSGLKLALAIMKMDKRTRHVCVYNEVQLKAEDESKDKCPRCGRRSDSLMQFNKKQVCECCLEELERESD